LKYPIIQKQFILIKITLIIVVLVAILSLCAISSRLSLGGLADVVPRPIKVNDMCEFSNVFSFGPVFDATPHENNFGNYNFYKLYTY